MVVRNSDFRQKNLIVLIDQSHEEHCVQLCVTLDATVILCSQP